MLRTLGSWSMSAALHGALAAIVARMVLLAPDPIPDAAPVASVEVQLGGAPAAEPVRAERPPPRRTEPIAIAAEADPSFALDPTDDVSEPAPPRDQPRRDLRIDRPLASVTRVDVPRGAGDASSSVAAPTPSHNPEPEYPRVARRRGYEGRVVARIRVSAQGEPLEVAIAASSGHDCLDDAVVEAVKLWHFEPARRDGRAVEGDVEVPFRFELRGR